MTYPLAKQEVFMQIAYVLAELGTCDRKHVGALIVRDGRCVSWGYNGAPSGAPHCSENNHGWAPPGVELQFDQSPMNLGCKNATHAEANAIAFAARQGISTEGSELFVTVSPCDVCARLVIAAGIGAVYYAEAYRKDDGCQILQKASIRTVQLK